MSVFCMCVWQGKRTFPYKHVQTLLIKKLLLQNVSNLYQQVQNWFWKPEMELSKQEMELSKQEMELFLLIS